MIMLISSVSTLTRIKMREGYITFPGMGSRRGQYAFLMSQSRFFMHFRPLIIILGYSASYFLETSMPVI